MSAPSQKRFAVGLSFPGDYQDKVQAIADILAGTFTQERVLFRLYHEAEFARPNFDTYLQNLFIEETDLVVIFHCQAFNEDTWCGVEWRGNRSRINTKDSQSIMFLGFDNKVPEGFREGVDYSVNISRKTEAEVAKLILDRYRLNKGIPVMESNPDPDPYVKLKQYLSHRLERTRDNHPSFQLMRIDDKLFPYCTNLYNLNVIDDSHTQKPIRKIIAESWSREQNHLMIEGEGGIGKTVTLLSLPEKFVPHKVPAIFIQLHELRQGESIKDYIRSSIFFDNEQSFGLFNELTTKEWEDGPAVLLLLDGFNEIANKERREDIGADINRWAGRPGVQIITTSRFFIHSVKLGREWSRIQLQPLDQETVADFLNSLDIPVPRDRRQRSVLSYPLMLTLFAQTEWALKYIEDTNDGIQDFHKRNTAGDIIWNYLQREIGRLSRENSANAVKSILSAEFVAPYLAWQMQKNGLFSLDEYSFWNYTDCACKIISELDQKSFPPHIQRVLRKSDLMCPTGPEIQRFIEDDLHLFIRRGTTYALMHQQFRDALAALHLINASFRCPEDELPEEWKEPVDDDVLTFVSELASQRETNRLWLQNKKGGHHNDIATINMLELQKLERKGNFSELDFSGLDLRNISLFPYRVPGSMLLQLPRSGNLCEGLAFSEKTFFPEGHSGEITVIAITPDGKRCVSGSQDGTLCIWDLKSGRWLGTLIGHDNYITALAITPDGRKCVSGSADNTLRVWELDSGKCLKELEGHTGSVKVIELVPGGKCISKSRDRTLRVWDLETGQCLKILHKYDNEQVTTMAISPDGKKCISGSCYFLCLWDLESGQCLKSLEGYNVAASTLAITPDGKKCVSESWDNSLRVWDLDSGQTLWVLKGHKRSVTTLAIISDDRCISGSEDETLRVWDLNTGECIKTLKGHDNTITTLSVIPGGRRCVSGSADNSLRVWDLDTGDYLLLEGHISPVTTHAVTPDGMFCVSGSQDKTLRIWNLESGRCQRTIEGWEEHDTRFAFSPDGRRCVSDSKDNALRIWDLEARSCIQVVGGREGYYSDFAISPDGGKCVSVLQYKSLCIWDLSAEGSRRIFKEDKGPVTSIVITPDGGKCIGVVQNKFLYVWDLDKDGRKKRSPEMILGSISSLMVTPDGKKCIGIIRRKNLCIWDLDSGQVITTKEGWRWGTITALAATPDGKHCISGSIDNNLHVWDLDSGEHLGELKGHQDSITALAVTKDGKLCISGSDDNTLRVWDLKSQYLIRTLKGHEASIISLAITPDGGKCVSSSADKTLRIWDVNSGKCIDKTDASVSVISITPDGERCFGGSSDGLLYEWDLVTFEKKTIRILPLTLKGVNFSLSNVSPDLKETLRQNGAIVSSE